MKVRFAAIDDAPLILFFIKKKIEFDRSIGAYSGTPRVSEEKIRQTLFGSTPFSYVLFVEDSGRAIGFALYGFRYSSFAGAPSIWLDDLYVDESMRSKGAGKILMEALARIASDNHCTHIAWNADARNVRGLNFYFHLGAETIDRRENRCFLRWIPENLSVNSRK
jgi:GNAT superfamily N-acetyltransferase